MATLKDVANLANVDVSTVSRALNNTSYVHPDTRARIMAAVEELSYKPNVLARGLRKGKLNTIAFVTPVLSFSIFSDVLAGIQEEGWKKGYATLVVITGDDKDVEKDSLGRLRNSFVDGIIIAGTGSNNRLIQDIHADMPLVQVVRCHDKNISSVACNYEEIGYQSTRHLIDKGCRHIGLITGLQKIKPYLERYRDYQKALAEAGLEEITAQRESKQRGLRYGYDCALKLLDENVHLDAILAATDAQGIGALRALKENGVSVPENMRVLSMTGHHIGDMLESSLTSMELPGRQIGESALDMLIRSIEKKADETPTVQHLTFSATLAERESTT